MEGQMIEAVVERCAGIDVGKKFVLDIPSSEENSRMPD